MVNQIFPESFYTRLLCSGDRIGVNRDEKFEILPPESSCSRLKRFLTFQQDPHIDRVHNLLKKLVEQAEKRQDLFPVLAGEMQKHGQDKCKYLEANLIYLREKLDNIGNPNCLSSLILKIANIVFVFFGYAPIQLKTYAKHYEKEGWLGIAREFDVRSIEQVGSRPWDKDENACIFSSDFPIMKRKIQSLETGLISHHLIDSVEKSYIHREMTMQIHANLEISFDPKGNCFLAAINNPKARVIYNYPNDNLQACQEWISPIFAELLRELPNKKKTFRYFVEATKEKVIHHELSWVLEVTEQAPFQLNRGSQHLVLEPDTLYRFYDENNQTVALFDITTPKK